MCGIVSIYKKNNTSLDYQDLIKMSSALTHRGPDEAGYALLNKGQVGLSHVRLSIIDLKNGQQPMFNEDYSIAITYNGEIYDYKKLRKDLVLKGHKFHSTSDTEVIIHLYEEYGIDFLDKINGEFALIIWDENKKQLIAARDRLGVKPLFYYESDNEILFASENKGIFALERVATRKISPTFLCGVISRVSPSSISVFEGINSLRPGHYLIIDEYGIYKEKPYWQQCFDIDVSMDFQTATTEICSLLEQAVKRRMVADVPVGVYLSGGIDSTLVCALMSKQGEWFKAFNIGFNGSNYDESDLARRIAGYYGAEFETFDCTMDKIAADFEKTVYHAEVPIFNPHSVAKQLLSKHVHNSGYKVCITGEGADEVFGGYPYFKLEKLWTMMLKGGQEKKKALKLWKKFKKIESRSEGAIWDRSKTWKKMDYYFNFPSFYNLFAVNGGGLAQKLYNTEALGIGPEHNPFTLMEKYYDVEALKKLHPFNITKSLSYNSMMAYVFPALGDRVEMANSIECRLPFLDRDILDFTGKIPPRYFINIDKLREKYILHEAFKNILPDFLGSIHKHPFLSPDWTCFKNTGKGKALYDHFLSDKEIRNSGLFNAKFVSLCKSLWNMIPWRSPVKKRLDNAIGTILSLQVLHKSFIQNRIPTNKKFKMVDRTPWVN